MVAWPCCFGPVEDSTSWREHTAEEACSLHGSQETKKETWGQDPNIPFKGTPPVT
jgi:hypothetical protein